MKRRLMPVYVDGEYLLWLFTRISALGMYLLVFLAVGGALFLGARRQMTLADLLCWGFMPIPNHVLNTNVPDIAPWATAFWRVTGIAMFFLASAHGLCGFLGAIEDFLAHAKTRGVLRVAAFCLWLALMVIGVYVILTS